MRVRMIKEDKMKESEEKEFSFRSYGKGELATLYSPYVRQQSAVDKLNDWIHAFPGLEQRLEAIGLRKSSRSYTPAQVRMIVEALGEP